MRTSHRPKILWAVDPFSPDEQSLDLSFRAAKALQEIWGRPIEPVYVLSPEGFHYPGDFSNAWIKNFLPHLGDLFEKKVAAYKGPKMLPVKVLINKGHGRRLAVKKLLSYAQKSDAAPIVLATQGKTGLERWIMGSFAESAILMARTPLCVIPPGAEITSFKKVLFPTNFSRSSKTFIQKQVSWLKKIDASVHLYHKLSEPFDPFVQSSLVMAGGGWVSVQAFLQDESLKRQQDGDKLRDQLVSKGIAASFTLDAKPGALTEGVLKSAAEKKAQLIALVSESSSVSAALVGSLARDLCRQASCPVWVNHSKES